MKLTDYGLKIRFTTLFAAVRDESIFVNYDVKSKINFGVHSLNLLVHL